MINNDRIIYKHLVIFQFHSGNKLEILENQSNCIAHSQCSNTKEWKVSEFLKADLAGKMDMSFCDACKENISQGSRISVAEAAIKFL